MPDNDLERELIELGTNVEYPRTPDIAGEVRTQLDHESAERAARRRWFHLPALSPRLAVAAALLLVLAIPALSPTMRGAISGLFVPNRGSETIQGAGEKPSPAQDARSSGAEANEKPSASDVGGDFRDSLGEQVTLSQARTRAKGQILLPHTQRLGEPDEIYAGGSQGKNYIVFVYPPRAGLPVMGNSGTGLLLTRFPDGLKSVYTAERTPNAPYPENANVGNSRAYWFPGGGALRNQPGKSESLPGSALLWEVKGHAMLLRADISREAAIRVADSVR